MLLNAQSSSARLRVSRSMRVGSRDSRSEHGQRVSLNSRKGLPLRRNKRLRRLSQSHAAESLARQAQQPSLVLHDLLWSQKSKLSRSTRTASRSQILPNATLRAREYPVPSLSWCNRYWVLPTVRSLRIGNY